MRVLRPTLATIVAVCGLTAAHPLRPPYKEVASITWNRPRHFPTITPAPSCAPHDQNCIAAGTWKRVAAHSDEWRWPSSDDDQGATWISGSWKKRSESHVDESSSQSSDDDDDDDDDHDDHHHEDSWLSGSWKKRSPAHMDESSSQSHDHHANDDPTIIACCKDKRAEPTATATAGITEDEDSSDVSEVGFGPKPIVPNPSPVDAANHPEITARDPSLPTRTVGLDHVDDGIAYLTLKPTSAAAIAARSEPAPSPVTLEFDHYDAEGTPWLRPEDPAITWISPYPPDESAITTHRTPPSTTAYGSEYYHDGSLSLGPESTEKPTSTVRGTPPPAPITAHGHYADGTVYLVPKPTHEPAIAARGELPATITFGSVYDGTLYVTPTPTGNAATTTRGTTLHTTRYGLEYYKDGTLYLEPKGTVKTETELIGKRDDGNGNVWTTGYYAWSNPTTFQRVPRISPSPVGNKRLSSSAAGDCRTIACLEQKIDDLREAQQDENTEDLTNDFIQYQIDENEREIDRLRAEQEFGQQQHDNEAQTSPTPTAAAPAYAPSTQGFQSTEYIMHFTPGPAPYSTAPAPSATASYTVTKVFMHKRLPPMSLAPPPQPATTPYHGASPTLALEFSKVDPVTGDFADLRYMDPNLNHDKDGEFDPTLANDIELEEAIAKQREQIANCNNLWCYMKNNGAFEWGGAFEEVDAANGDPDFKSQE